jgi:predicted ATPase
MRINRILIKGYRSLKEIDWEPGSLNVVIGPNGTGKSNLLRFLELIGAASTGNLSKYIQKAGGIKPLLWDSKVDSFSFRLEISLPALNSDHWEDDYTYEVLLRQVGSSGDYQVESEYLTVQNQNETLVNSEPEKLLYRNKQKIIIYDDSGGELDMPENVVSHEELLLAIAANPFSGIKQVNVFQKALSSFAVYHDLYVHRESLIRQPAVTRYETTVAADGQNLVSVLHTLYTGDRHFKNAIDSAMQAAFGYEYVELVFPPASDQRVQLRVRWSSLDQEQSAADLSDGTLYFLLLMTILNNPRPPVLIAIDEPETGLHPSMLPVVAEHAVEVSCKAQVIFTTHSSQFLDAFADVKPVTTVASWLNGETRLKVLDGEELNYWLSNYTLGSLFISGELENM